MKYKKKPAKVKRQRKQKESGGRAAAKVIKLWLI